MSKKQTLRLTCPQWQGGVNPNYVFGAELLSFIAPPSTTDKSITICIKKILIQIAKQKMVWILGNRYMSKWRK